MPLVRSVLLELSEPKSVTKVKGQAGRQARWPGGIAERGEAGRGGAGRRRAVRAGIRRRHQAQT